MRKIILAGSFFCLTSLFAVDSSMFIGKWEGTVKSNIKEQSSGGAPTTGGPGTAVIIDLKPDTANNSKVTGTSKVGTDEETWTFEGKNFQLKTGPIELTAKETSFKQIPEWVKKQMGLKESDKFAAYAFENCTVMATKEKCKSGEKGQLPDGIEKNGIFIFQNKGNMLVSNVYYTYSNGKNRILELDALKK